MTWTRSDNQILATLQDLVAIDSVDPALPGGQQGEGRMVEYLSSFFTALDIPYELSEVLPGTDEEAHIVSSAAEACRTVLGEATISGVPYATDGSPFSARGIPTIVLGPGSIDQAHGAVEWVDCQQVVQAVDIYQQIMQSPV